jgi:DNA gyrase subunit A
MRESFLDYSMSVIVQRALPDVCDGLKPVHRRILYAMFDLGLVPGRPYKKSASVVGEVLGKYHPHGDSAVYDSLVRMVQDFALRYPLIDGQGNFGSVDGDSAAAYRYTEARLTGVAMDLLEDLGRDTVGWSPNFDSRLEEPMVLPAKLPNLLVNGSSGIAVGMSTNIPPHNLGEVAEAIRAFVHDPEITNSGLREHLPGPDFPTAGFIVGDQGIKDMYETGRGRVVMRARIIRESLRAGRQQLVVTELPYAVSKSKVVERVAGLARGGKLEGVADLRDESDRDGIRVVIELKRGADVGPILRTLYKSTPLQSTFGVIMLALDNGQPREFDLRGMIEAYRNHRLLVIERRTRHDLTKAEDEYHITVGLITALDAIDEVIRVIRESKDRPEASRRLRKALDLSEIQAEAILNMRLGKLTNLETADLRQRLAELEAILAGLEAILGSEEKRLEILLEELDGVVERHGNPRRTEILYDTAETDIPVESEMADEDVIVTMSHEGFVKRMPVALYRRRVGSGKALAGMERHEDDWLESIFAARTSGWLLAFTAGGARPLPARTRSA